jgi:hypothetical protein
MEDCRRDCSWTNEMEIDDNGNLYRVETSISKREQIPQNPCACLYPHNIIIYNQPNWKKTFEKEKKQRLLIKAQVHHDLKTP